MLTMLYKLGNLNGDIEILEINEIEILNFKI